MHAPGRPSGPAEAHLGIGHGREIFPYGTSSHTHGDDDENFSSIL